MSQWLDAMRLQAALQVNSLGQPRHAIVTSVDPVAHAVKVMVQPDGQESGWIPDGAAAAGSLRICCPSEIGTQVLVVPVEGDAEHPILVSRLFDVVHTPPSSPATTKPVQPGEVGVFIQDGAYIHMTGNNIYLKGSVIIDGSLRTTDDVIAAGVSLSAHVHGEVATGSAFSAKPEPTSG